MINPLQEFAGTPWAMMPVRLAALAESVARRVEEDKASAISHQASAANAAANAAASAAAGGAGASRHGIAVRQGGLAVVSVGGVILGSDPWWARYDPTGFTNTGVLAGTLAELRADPSVRGVLLQVDSPGGSVAGVAEAHSAVADLVAAGKPVHVHAGNLMASAAYWIGSAASGITIGRSASVGSIGVYTVIYDYSGNLAKYGIAAHLVKAGRDKGAGQGDVPVTAEQLAVIQREIDGLYAVFTADVARARKLSGDEVAASATGEVFVGAEAVKRKLADRVVDGAAVRAELVTRFGRAGGAGRANLKTIVRPVESRSAHAKDARPPAAANSNDGNGSKEMKTKTLMAAVMAAVAAGDLATPLYLKTGAGTIAAPRGHNGSGGGGGAFSRTLHVPDPNGDGAAGGGEGAGDGAVGVAVADVDAIAAGVLAKIGPGIGKLVTEAVNAAAPKAVGDAMANANKAKADREAKIRSAAAGFAHVEGVRAAVEAAVADEGLTVEAAQGKIMEAAAKGLAPIGGGVISIGAEAKDKRLNTLAISLIERVMGSGKLEAIANGGDKTLAAVNKLGFESHADLRKARLAAANSDLSEMSLKRFVALTSHDRSLHSSENGDRIIASLGSHTSSDFPNLMAGVINKTVLATMQLIPTTYQQWCSIGSASDFRTQNLVEIGPGGELKEIGAGGTLEQGTIDDRGTTARVKTYGRKISITREMIINDDVDAVSRIIQNWAASARLLPEILAMQKLKTASTTAFAGTGNNFLSSGHGNLATAAALTMDTLDALFLLLRTMKWTAGSNTKNASENRNDLFMQDVGLVLAGENQRSKLSTLQKAQNDPDNATTKVNIVQGQFEYTCSKLLDTTAAGAASKQYYVVASAASGRAPIRVTFLNGRREPIFNPVGNGSILSQDIEVIFDANADYETPEAIVGNLGL